VLVAADGRIVPRAAAQYPTHRPEPGAAEQHPEDWLKAFTSVTLGLAKAVTAERWRAVGLSAMLPTLVLTDGVGAAATPGGIDAPSWHRPLEPLGPAITWEDGRAEAEGSAFRGTGRRCPGPQPFRLVGVAGGTARVRGRRPDRQAMMR
jgi:xylulokinase